MWSGKTQMNDWERQSFNSQSMADNYERQQKTESGIRHTVLEPKLSAIKQEDTPFIIGYCKDCEKPIMSDKGSCTLVDKRGNKQLFCRSMCADNYYN